MSRITVIENAVVTLWYYPDTKIVHHQMHGFFQGQQFREVVAATYSLFAQHSATKWLADDRKIPVLSQEDIAWARQNWLGRARAVGFKHLAMVRPTKALGKMGVEGMVKELLGMGVNARLFEEPEPAMAWLESI